MTTYTLSKTIKVVGLNLIESSDLTPHLSTFVGTHSYLVLTSGLGNVVTTVLSLDRIFLYVENLDLTQPISTGLTSLLTDLFVSQYSDSSIPVKGSNGYYSNRLIVYNPISYKDVQVAYGSLNQPGVENEPDQRGFLDDLVITSDITTLNNVLISVNGVFHSTVYSSNINTLWVKDGFRTMRLTDRKDVNLIDTTNIGGHTVVPLTTSNVTQNTYNGWAHITLPSSIAGKTIAIVIDGYFYHLDTHVLNVIDDTHIGIRTNLIPFIQQFKHNPRTVYTPDLYGQQAVQTSRKYSDVYADVFLNKRYASASTFETVAFQLSRLTAFHSFLVVFNEEKLFTVETSIQTTGTPKFYYDYADDTLSGMAVYGCGLTPSYLIDDEVGGRRQIFLSEQDNALDYEYDMANIPFIPSQIIDAQQAAHKPLRFVDYVSA